ncbi:MAG: hypothetical protein IKF39_01830 [Oscillospiraceae bacterium]|nr:hypothetical protein [Oscillospiraceae bacterium]
MKDIQHPYRSLAAAIVLRAIVDYLTDEDWLRRHKDMTWVNAKPQRLARYHECLWELKEVEQFFKSQWFGLLSDQNGEEILHKLKTGQIRRGAANNAARLI